MDRVHHARQARDIRAPRTPSATRTAASLKPRRIRPAGNHGPPRRAAQPTRILRRVSLETGTTAAFAPARALYRRAGFILCGPFAGYQPSDDNLFMTLELDAVPPGLLASRARTRSAPVIMGATDQTTGTRKQPPGTTNTPATAARRAGRSMIGHRE
jgi:hypothetical protein